LQSLWLAPSKPPIQNVRNSINLYPSMSTLSVYYI
jgi:hypothetical protein